MRTVYIRISMSLSLFKELISSIKKMLILECATLGDSMGSRSFEFTLICW